MPDVREVFQMSTQKVKPEPGFVDRQHDHRDRRERRRKDGAFVVVAALGLVVLLVFLTTRPGGNATKPADVSSSPTPIFSPFRQPFFLDLATGAETAIPDLGGALYTASPDGTKLIFGHCCTTGDVVTLANIDGTDAHPITPTVGLSAYGPAWSPDGTDVVYQLRDADTLRFGSLIVEDVATGATTKLATLHGRHDWWFVSPSFSPDGSAVLFHLPRKGAGVWDVWSVPVTGGAPAKVLTDAGFPRYFPDGREIAFVSGMTSGLSGNGLSIANADGSRRTLVEAKTAIAWPAISPDGTRIAYQDGASIYVVDVATGTSTEMATGGSADWLDDDTLIVSP